MVRLPVIPPSSDAYRIVGATLLDGTLRGPVEDAEVEVADGRIAYAGPRRHGEQRGVRAIDAAGCVLMPGFIDAHVHLCMSTDASAEEQRGWFPEQQVVAVLRNLRSTIDAGVTTARDLSGLTPGYRASIAAGDVTGPRLHLAIAMLSPTGGHADPVMANGSLPLYAERATTPGWAVVDTLDEVIKAVRMLVRTGADAIKVCTSGGMSTQHDDPADRGVPQEHIEAIVAEMRARAGQPVAAHAQNDEGSRAAVLGGVASIEHGYDLSEQTVAMMIERGTVLVPTLSTLLRGNGGDTVRRARALDSIRGAIRAGVKVVLGTDAGIHGQGRNLTELGHLVRAGLTPLEAIHAGTQAGARLLRLDPHLGTLEAGKLADLVLASADPLVDIDALALPDCIRMVAQGGRIVKDMDARA